MGCKTLIEERKKLWGITKDIDADLEWRVASWREIISDRKTFEELLEKPWLLIELQFVVIDKDFNEVPFFLNEVQRDFQDNTLGPLYIKQLYKEVEQIKIKILKGRQQGFTTYITAFQLCLALTLHGFRGFTMAHDSESTSSIFTDISKGFYDSLIDEIREEPKRSNARELVLESNKSAWRVATAGSKRAGRGKKLKMLHNSEKAFWENMRKNAAAISQALTKYSIEIDETTANGFNEFKEDWDDIREGNSKWLGVFYAWYRTSEYRKSFKGTNYTEYEFLEAVENGERFMGVDSKFMKLLNQLLNTAGLDKYQVHWYFDKRLELKDLVFQEYPCTEEQAFLYSGNPYFDIELLDLLLMKKYKPLEVLNNGEIEIYEYPSPGERYVIGSDVAEGLEEADSSTFFILNVRTGEEVANGEYIMTPDNHGRVLDKYSKMYNNALIAVERNNHGHSVLNTLENECKASLRLYITQADAASVKKTQKDKYGWQTTEPSKYFMLDELDTAIRREYIKIKSTRTLKQLRSVIKENGKISVNGKDLVVAVAISWAVRKSRPVAAMW
ncbi:hypothetical protein VSU16_04705 [Cetobacterium somerae]|uniref:hypothetical protein n=1 Tax=Cetobacterium somerae TaxID=188913 RepID=UPI002E7AD6F9|nr:hypothetical protein [Cetobacterium somerae]WVJ02044.1 hypothetical protein VSU16_04705 [Cetobacterium somerae]